MIASKKYNNISRLSGKTINPDRLKTISQTLRIPEISKTIIDKGADYVLALKDNQGTLHDNVELFFQDYLNSATNQPAFDFYQSTDGDHGRVEIRKYWMSSLGRKIS